MPSPPKKTTFKNIAVVHNNNKNFSRVQKYEFHFFPPSQEMSGDVVTTSPQKIFLDIGHVTHVTSKKNTKEIRVPL
jgi:hypothetical protein